MRNVRTSSGVTETIKTLASLARFVIADVTNAPTLICRPRKLTPHQRREAIARRDTGDESLTDIARSYNVSHSTISRL